MKTLSLYIDKWYIVGSVNDDSGPKVLSLSNKERRIWLYFYNNISANKVEYGYKFKEHALAGELNYYTDIFNLILGSEGKTYKLFSRNIEMRTIFHNAGVFSDLKECFGNKTIDTYISFSPDIKLEGQSIFLSLLHENGFNVKEFVAQLDFLALEYAYRKGLISECSFILVANASNENLHYSLYHQEDDFFTLLGTKTLYGLGEDLRSRAIVEQVIEIINSSTHILSTEEEFNAEHLYLSRFTSEWIDKIDASYKNVPTPLGWVNFKKQSNNKYPITVQKSVIDKRTSIIIDDIVTEIVKLLEEHGIKNHQISNILFIGDTFDNDQFKKSLAKHIPVLKNGFIHFHEDELGHIINVYHDLPSEWFDDDEKRFTKLSEAEKSAALSAKKQKEKLEEARKRDEQEFLHHQQETEKNRNLQNALTAAQSAEKNMRYEEALGLYKTANAIDSTNSYINQKIDELTVTISDLKSKKKQYDEYIANARQAYDSKNWENAVAQSRLALGVMPDSYDAKELLKDAENLCLRYARLKECINQIDFFIEKKAFQEAMCEIKNAEFLNIKDPIIEERKRIVSIEIERIQNEISSLKLKLEASLTEQDYDLAISLCSELAIIDANNKLQWATKKETINSIREQQQSTLRELRQLREKIDEKHLAQDWSELLSLCQSYLSIKNDIYIQELSKKAEEQIEIDAIQQQFDTAYESQDWQVILSLSKTHSSLKKVAANNRVIQEAMAQKRKKKTSESSEITVIDADTTSQRQSHHRYPKKKASATPITLLSEEDVKINFSKPNRKPHRKINRSIKAEETEEKSSVDTTTTQTNSEKVSFSTNTTSKKRKFPKVKRNK